jgi:hypothetical protein
MNIENPYYVIPKKDQTQICKPNLSADNIKEEEEDI